MLKLIKMDLYRMFHTKAFYIIWIILAAAVIFSTTMSKEDYKYIQEEAAKGQLETVSEENNLNFGLSVSLPTKPGEKVTVFDQVFANMQSKFVALFLVIFAVLFSTADITSGYIKNIGGQIKGKRKSHSFKSSSIADLYRIDLAFLSGYTGNLSVRCVRRVKMGRYGNVLEIFRDRGNPSLWFGIDLYGNGSYFKK